MNSVHSRERTSKQPGSPGTQQGVGGYSSLARRKPQRQRWHETMTKRKHTPYHWILLAALLATFCVLAVAVSPPFVYFSFEGESDRLHKLVCWIGAFPIVILLVSAIARRFLKSPRVERVLGVFTFFVTPIWLLLAALGCALLSFRLDVAPRINYWLTSSIGFLAGAWVFVLVPWFRRQ